MKILFATMKPTSYAKHTQGIILQETQKSYLIRTLGIGAIIRIKKAEIERYHIEFPPPVFTQLRDIRNYYGEN
jgi:hypothetical protein